MISNQFSQFISGRGLDTFNTDDLNIILKDAARLDKNKEIKLIAIELHARGVLHWRDQRDILGLITEQAFDDAVKRHSI